MNLLTNIINNSLTDKNTIHSYLPTYQKLFDPIQLSATHILEIGVASGGSILLWHDFFHNAEIHGIDKISIPNILKTHERIKFHQCNAYKFENIKELFIDKNIKFDVIIDDGPHKHNSMIKMAQYYNQLLKPNGLLIIEDVKRLDWVPPIKNVLPIDMQNSLEIVDNRHIKNRYDDIMIIARRPY
jgi:cephalosporin hydroxylase